MLLAVMRRLAWALVVIVAVAAGAGVMSLRTERAPSEPFDERLLACDLVTADEVADAIGGRVRTPDAAEGAANDALAGRSGCAWSRSDEHAAVLVELVRTNDMAASVRRTGFSAAARFRAARSRAEREVAVPLGDDAFWVDDEATLHLLRAGSYVVFEVAVPSGVDARNVANDLGRAAVDRLDQWSGAN